MTAPHLDDPLLRVWSIRAASQATLLEALIQGTTHEVNNPIQVLVLDHPTVSTFATIALERVAELDPGGTLDGLPLDTVGELTRESSLRVDSAITKLSDRAATWRALSAVGSPAFVPTDPEADLALWLGLAEARPGAAIEVSLEIAPPPAVFPRHTFVELLEPLVENARWASLRGDGSPVQVRLAPTAKTLLLEVSDRGPGVAADIHPTAHKVFVTSRAAEGHPGLGLACVTTVCSQLGGRLSLCEREGGGTTARVEVPRGGGG